MSRLVVQGTIFDSMTGVMVEHQAVVIEDGKFVWIGPTEDYRQMEGDIITEDKGDYILPGLIDCHVHLEGTTRVDWAQEMMRQKDGMLYYVALRNAQSHLRAGFTTLRDCGGEPWGAVLRRALAEQLFYGPRLYVAQHTISQWGNQEAIGPEWYLDFTRAREVISGVDGVRHAVRERKRLGSDFVKTMTTGGVLHGIESQLDRSLWTDEELQVMVDEAHRLGMLVAVHAHGLHGIQKAVKAGVDTIEHGSFLDEPTAEIMAKNGTILVPTQTSAFMDKPELMSELEPEVREKTLKVDQAMLVNHQMAFEKGVKIACGTDAGVPGNPHGTSARELSIYVDKLGMSPSQALQSATSIAAEALGQLHVLGSISVGKLADLVILTKNPLEDIHYLENVKNIASVIKDGVVMVSQGSLGNQ